MTSDPDYKNQLIQEFEGLFDQADTNKDGVLDESEWPVFVGIQYEYECGKFGGAV